MIITTIKIPLIGQFEFISNPTLTNCIFSGNKAGSGGGMYNYRISNPILTNCTFAGNCAANGNALACDDPYQPYQQMDPSNVLLTNCIVWDGGNEIWNNDNSVITIAYSDIQGGFDGIGNIDADLCFVDPGFWDSNGTPGDANDDFWIDGDYYLMPASPCIDTGDPCYISGPNETDLDGNPRVIGGRIDMGVYETNYLDVPMKFTPQALNLSSGGKLLKAHFVLPEGFSVEDVDVNTPAVIELFGVESYKIKVLLNDEGLVRIEAAFNRSDLCSSITSYDHNIEVMVTGWLITGQQFYGTDIIKITNRAFDHLAILVSQWLQEDCTKPHWCDGADLNADSVVNFLDFALLAPCCIEVIAK